jgi:hypothetical protein
MAEYDNNYCYTGHKTLQGQSHETSDPPGPLIHFSYMYTV